MALSNSWDETHPAGSDFVSSLDDQGRQLKLDIRERMALQHYWASSVSGNNEDGVHKEIAITPTADNIWILKTNVNQIISGAASTALVDLGVTWNTSGAPTGFKLNVTDTLSNASSLLCDLQVGGVSTFAVRKDGTLTTGSVPETRIPDGALLARVAGNETITGSWNVTGPSFSFTDNLVYTIQTTAALNEKRWITRIVSSVWKLQAIDDALTGTNDAIAVHRVAHVPSEIDFFPLQQQVFVPSQHQIISQALGATTGPNVDIGRNTSGSACTGTVSIVNVGATRYFLWPDNTGTLRIGATAPTTSGGDTGGGVVGAQTSNLEAKNIIREFTENMQALQMICNTPLFHWEYRNGSMRESEFMGAVTNYSPFLGMDNGKSLNVASAIGYLIASVKELERRTRTV